MERNNRSISFIRDKYILCKFLLDSYQLKYILDNKLMSSSTPENQSFEYFEGPGALSTL